MQAIFVRLLRVLWCSNILLFLFNGLFVDGEDAIYFGLIFSISIIAIQYVLLGSFNPIRLFERKNHYPR